MCDAHRMVVGTIPTDARRMLRDFGIEEGDVLEAPEGFPNWPDDLDNMEAPPVTLTRILHPNVAAFLAALSKTSEHPFRLQPVARTIDAPTDRQALNSLLGELDA